MIRLLICDDQDVVRQGLNTIFRYAEGIEVVGLAANGADALAQAAAHAVDVVLMDLKMPVMNGIQATRELVALYPATHVVVLTTFDADEWVFDAIRAGAVGYLLKDAGGEAIVTAVRDAHDGRTHLDPTIAGKILTAFNALDRQPQRHKREDAPAFDPLTEREMSILRLMVQGKSNQTIADELFLAAGTIKNNVSQILSKLQANDRTQAVLKALRTGLFDLED